MSNDTDKPKLKISWIDRVESGLRARGTKIVVIALVGNTMIAQLLFNSAGQAAINNQFVQAYLIISAICSTIAFALFEVSVIFQLHDLMSLDKSIKAEIEADKLIRRGFIVLGVSSFVNFISVLYFLALAWHGQGSHKAAFDLTNLPAPWNVLEMIAHAGCYTAIMFLAGIFGDRPRSSKEQTLQTQRELETLSLSAWDRQQRARIAYMETHGQSLDVVSAALASPETAERIAIMSAATSGQIDALTAAALNLSVNGMNTGFVDRIITLVQSKSTQQSPETIDKSQTLAALPEPEQRVVSASEIALPKPAETTPNVATVSPSEQPITSPDDPRLGAIPLPAGWSLETMQTQKALYEAFGVPASTASNALRNVRFTNGSHGAKLYETWEALACFLNAEIPLQPTFQANERYSETTPEMITAYAESAA